MKQTDKFFLVGEKFAVPLLTNKKGKIVLFT